MTKHSFKKIIIYAVIALISITGCVHAVIKHYTPLVSVVMPVYNREDLVARAIESVLSQTFTDFEFIIVDDGSTDNTPKILNDYASIDRRIKIIRNETNRGISFSRNRGIQAARGTYIATMDSDDYSVPERLAKSVRFMKEHPDVDALSGDIERITPEIRNFNEMSENLPDDQYTTLHEPGFYEVDLLFYNNFFNVASMYKNSFVKKHNIHYKLNYKAAEDYDFWFQFAKKGGKLASIKDILVFFRSHHTNTKEYYDAMISNSLALHKEGFSMFFNPSNEEIAFAYSVFEKCPLLKKIIAGNQEKHVMPQEYLQNYYKPICPASEEYYMLTHPSWEAYLEKTGENRWRRLETDIYANVIEKGNNKITVAWENYPPEDFVLNTQNNTYSYMPHDRKVELNHPYWKDTFWIDETLSVGCREKSLDCGEYTFSNDNKNLMIKWKGWPPEEFIQTDNGYQLKEKESK